MNAAIEIEASPSSSTTTTTPDDPQDEAFKPDSHDDTEDDGDKNSGGKEDSGNDDDEEESGQGEEIHDGSQQTGKPQPGKPLSITIVRGKNLRLLEKDTAVNKPPPKPKKHTNPKVTKDNKQAARNEESKPKPKSGKNKGTKEAAKSKSSDEDEEVSKASDNGSSDEEEDKKPPAKSSPKKKPKTATECNWDCDPLNYLDAEKNLPRWATVVEPANTNSQNFATALMAGPQGDGDFVYSSIYYVPQKVMDMDEKVLDNSFRKKTAEDMALVVLPCIAKDAGYRNPGVNGNSNCFKGMQKHSGKDAEAQAGHNCFEYKKNQTVNHYCMNCSDFTCQWQDSSYCLILRSKLFPVSDEEALENLKAGKYYVFNDLADVPRKYTPKLYMDKLPKDTWPPIPIGPFNEKLDAKKQFVPVSWVLDQLKNHGGGLIQTKAKIIHAYPHPAQCREPVDLRLWKTIDPENFGSGMFLLDGYPTHAIWMDLFEKLIEAIESRPIDQPLGERITNGLDSYPYDNRVQISLPVQPSEPVIGSLVDALSMLRAMRRHVLWVLNFMGFPDHFTHEHLKLGVAYPSARCQIDVDVHTSFNGFKLLAGGHSDTQQQRKAGFTNYSVPPPFHCDHPHLARGSRNSSALVPVSLLPELNGLVKPSTTIIPVTSQGRTIEFPMGYGLQDAQHELKIDMGSGVYMTGDTIHRGTIIPQKGGRSTKQDWNCAVFVNMDSSHYKRPDNKIWIPRDPTLLSVDQFSLYAGIDDYAKQMVNHCSKHLTTAAKYGPKTVQQQCQRLSNSLVAAIQTQERSDEDHSEQATSGELEADHASTRPDDDPQEGRAKRPPKETTKAPPKARQSKRTRTQTEAARANAEQNKKRKGGKGVAMDESNH